MRWTIRRAVSAEAGRLTELARAAKAHWGYPPAWLAAWEGELTITPATVAANHVFAAAEGGTLVGERGKRAIRIASLRERLTPVMLPRDRRPSSPRTPRSRGSMQPPPAEPGPEDSPRSSEPGRVPTEGLHGWITHTEFASADPAATREWCAKVLGWKFRPSFTMPSGEYHRFAYSDQGGGGIHQCDPPEAPGSIPFVHVADAHAAFDKALAEGAVEVTPPTRVMEGVTIGVVRAPGGVLVGFSGR